MTIGQDQKDALTSMTVEHLKFSRQESYKMIDWAHQMLSSEQAAQVREAANLWIAAIDAELKTRSN